MNARTDGFVGALQGVELDERDARTGDRVRVLVGPFANLLGTVTSADEVSVLVALDETAHAHACGCCGGGGEVQHLTPRISLALWLAEVEVLDTEDGQ